MPRRGGYQRPFLKKFQQQRQNLSKIGRSCLKEKSERSTLAGWLRNSRSGSLHTLPAARTLWASPLHRAHRHLLGYKTCKACPAALANSYHAGVSSDRTNLSPFTKDYRGLALPCDFSVFAARRGTISTQQQTKKQFLLFTKKALHSFLF